MAEDTKRIILPEPKDVNNERLVQRFIDRLKDMGYEITLFVATTLINWIEDPDIVLMYSDKKFLEIIQRHSTIKTKVLLQESPRVQIIFEDDDGEI